MKVQQIVSEHKKGFRAKKYAAKPKKYIEPVKPQGPVGTGEKVNENINFGGKGVNLRSLEVDGVDTKDYPDFSDAYFSYGEFEDGTQLSDEQLDMLTDKHGDLVHQMAYDSLHEGSIEETQPGGMVGKISAVDKSQGTANIQGPDGATKTVDITQLKPGENNTVTLNTPELNPGTTVNAEKSMEEGPEVPYFVDVSSGTPMAKTSPRPTQIIPSKLWTAITPDIEARASAQGFRRVMLQANNKQYVGLEGGDQKLGSKIIVSPSDYTALSGTATPAQGLRESADLSRIKVLSGL
jgi:hypothetical protein